jgi:uncharacterized protein
MKDGFKVWDTDTHIRPSLETLEPFMDAALRARLPDLEQYKRLNSRDDEGLVPGVHYYDLPGRMIYRRPLGQAEALQGSGERKTTRGKVAELGDKKWMGGKNPTVGSHDNSPAARIKDMDEEGVDVNLMIGQGPISTPLNDRALDVGFYFAYNRFLDDFCGRYPHRLKAVIPVFADMVEEAVDEVQHWAGSPWMVGVYPHIGNDLPLDHPSLTPIWQAVDEHGLVVLHHSSAQFFPYYPGYLDLWDNVFLNRAAAHPWGAMRAMGAFIGGGLLERYTSLRYGILESGCGWLPFWSRRLEDQAAYVGGVAPLEESIAEQIAGGRFFSSIEMAEGEDMIRMVADFLGPDMLMYASDFPHHECRFPDSVNYFMSWHALPDDLRRKILWDNPVRFYGEP